MAGKTYEILEALGVASTFADLGSAGAGTTTPDLANGLTQKLTLSAATRTIGAPLFNGGVVGANVPAGTELQLIIKNSSGGAVTITWNAIFTQAATAPASTKTRAFKFVWDGTNWVQSGVGLDV